MTSNEYLAGRDFAQLEPCFRLLGVSLGLLRGDDSPDRRSTAYACEITYGAGNEFGFDYLKDQVALLQGQGRRLGVRFRRLLRENVETPERSGLQRDLAYAIVDEIDSVLIDEANTPLILSAAADSASDAAASYTAAWRTSQEMCLSEDFLLDARLQNLRLTAAGLGRIRAAGRRAAKRGLNRSWEQCVEQALRAAHLLERDVDYVVVGDKLQLVDAATGRICADRSLRDGLQQLLEIKEQVPLTPEKASIARITRQRFFRLYDHVCGLTGTAAPSAGEFRQIYGLPVVTIPPRLPSRRSLRPSRFFTTAEAKWRAIAEHIRQVHAAGQPVLAGTTSIQNSLLLAERLRTLGVEFQLLNGIQDADEAAVVSAAGQIGAVTIATNMAGRGTDIRLGPGVAELGGLHVAATEHQPSVRLDGQLAGRAGRQGDPGSAQFFLSCEDPLVGQHAPELAARMCRLSRSDGEIVADLAREVAATQRKVEYWMFQQRRRLAMSVQWLEEVVEQLAAED
jgi:preprotein translocase subunit SecA